MKISHRAAVYAVIVLALFSVGVQGEQQRIERCEDVQIQNYLAEIVTFYNTNVVDGDYSYASTLIGNNKIVNINVDNETYSISIDDEGIMQGIRVGSDADASLQITSDHCTIRDMINDDLTLDEALDSDKIIMDGTTVMNDIRVVLVEFVVDVISVFS